MQHITSAKLRTNTSGSGHSPDGWFCLSAMSSNPGSKVMKPSVARTPEALATRGITELLGQSYRADESRVAF